MLIRGKSKYTGINIDRVIDLRLERQGSPQLLLFSQFNEKQDHKLKIGEREN